MHVICVIATVLTILGLALQAGALHAQEATPTPPSAAPAATVQDADLNRGIEGDEEFEAIQERIRAEQRFATLRTRRRHIVDTLPKLKAQLDSIQTDMESLQVRQREINEMLSAGEFMDFGRFLERRKADIQEKIAEVQRQSTRNEEQISDLETKKVELERQIKEATAEGDKKRQSLQDEIAQIKAMLVAKTAHSNQIGSDLSKLLEEQYAIDDQINTLLIPDTARNAFKLYITIAFSMLVGAVIIGFFVIAYKDEIVRRSILSSQSGIQFLTLFSLVIAIILFGITNILGGKELAALLGGLSGYILGRVTDRPAQP